MSGSLEGSLGGFPVGSPGESFGGALWGSPLEESSGEVLWGIPLGAYYVLFVSEVCSFQDTAYPPILFSPDRCSVIHYSQILLFSPPSDLQSMLLFSREIFPTTTWLNYSPHSYVYRRVSLSI